jgi:1-acyl-sn-glycerol-3-phosphate acyltransferase
MKDFVTKVFYVLIIRPWLSLIIGVSFKNTMTFNGIDQFIVVANHNSHFDIVAIIAGLPTKKITKVNTVAAGDYFGKNKLTRFLMSLFFNAVMIKRKRDSSEKSPIDELDKILKNGNSLVLFPEGSRGKPGIISDFKKGIAILLKLNPSIPFIPVYLDGFGRVLPKDKRLIIPLKCRVRFGEPLYAQNNDIESILSEVREAVLSLKNSDERDLNKFSITNPNNN